ncbi:MAG: hypothetical protein OXI25_00055 [Chloroflexota bacterium]|nr:hypothetical protein [Chloroflexota bacterium]
MTTQAASPAKTETQEPSYAIRPDLIEAQGRSVNAIVAERLCTQALQKAKSPEAVRKMSFKQLRNLARRNCANDPDYIPSQAPVLEAAFRMLLSAPTDSLPLRAIHDRITDLWASSPRPRHISEESLARVLSRDSSYGIAEVEAAEEE